MSSDSSPQPTSPDDGENDRIAFLIDQLGQLVESDRQVRDALPNADIAKAAADPDMPIAQILAMVMERYADRPAIGTRHREAATDPATGRTVTRLLPEFETITYGELWRLACAAVAEWVSDT